MEHGHMSGSDHHGQAHLAYNLLKWTYGLFFIVAGLDKFFNMVTMWQQYVGPFVIKVAPMELNQLMMGIGAFEVVLGALMLAKPKLGGILAAIWFAVVAANLINMGVFYDIAARDIVLAVGAFVLSLMTCTKD